MDAIIKPTIMQLEEILEKEGFRTSWKDPFFSWLNQLAFEKGEPEQGLKSRLYILDPPIPKVAPFDFAAASLMIDWQIFFSLSIYYCRVLENVSEAEEFHQIYDQHALYWTPPIAIYFNNIACEYSLNWDSEYDACIEDTLFGTFPLEKWDQVLSLVRKIWNKY